MKIWDQISIRKVRRQILGNHLFSQIISFSSDPDCQFLWMQFKVWSEALVVFVVSFSSSWGTNMRLHYSLSHALFSEKKPYIQLRTKFKDWASYISFWLRATCTKFAFTNEKRCTVCTHSIYFSKLVHQ
jgi:hypothetical protein